MSTTADILTATWGALRSVRDHLDRLSGISAAQAKALHTNLRGAVVLLFRVTDSAIYFPADDSVRQVHAHAVAQLLDANEAALDYLEGMNA
jgi:hypothetical protein